MDGIRTICYPFLLTAIFFCMYGIYYIKHWQRKNPWYKQNDDEMRLSPQERAYRQNERRKYNNIPFVVFGALFVCLLMMVLLLQKEANGGWNLAVDWIYAIPFVGAIFLALSGIKRK